MKTTARTILKRTALRETRVQNTFAMQFLADSQNWINRQLISDASVFRPPRCGIQRNLSKTFELSDFNDPKVREFARSILDFLGDIDYNASPYQARLGPIMNGHAYAKIWEVAYLAAMSGIGQGSDILIAASGPSYWIPVWHKEALRCNVTCFEKNKHYNDFVLDESIYRQHGIQFSYQDAASFHYNNKFNAILSHCSIEHFFGGAALDFILRSDRYLENNGILGCATQIWNPSCTYVGLEVPDWGYTFFGEQEINQLMQANPSLISLDGQPFHDYQDWSNFNFFEVDPGKYVFDGEECKTIVAAFFLRKA